MDPSWFVILFLIIWSLSGYFQDLFPGDDTKAFALATLSALLFFTSILLHELGHAWVAIRNGIEIESIDLWLMGGVAHLKRDSQSAGEEFRVAAAGPAVTLVIAVLAGYSLARLRYRGVGSFGTAVFITYLVPPTLLFLPLSQVVVWLGFPLPKQVMLHVVVLGTGAAGLTAAVAAYEGGATVAVFESVPVAVSETMQLAV